MLSRTVWSKIFSVLLFISLVFSLANPGRVEAMRPTPPREASSISASLDVQKTRPSTLSADRTDPLAKIEPTLLAEVSPAGQSEFFVWMTEKADLSPAYQLKTKKKKGQFVFDTLRETAERTQNALRKEFDRQGVTYQPFYIANKILVRDGTQSMLFTLAARPDVARITANHQIQLEEPIIDPTPSRQILSLEPNISFVNANDVWVLGHTGSGTVLAGNDTGLDWNHPALINQYRGWNGASADHNYNWWDATGTYPNTPGDGHGHGTHTSGTMVGNDGGSNQIGMAPGARTIHCKNLTDSGSGSEATITECFEWDLAPWDLTGNNPRPDLAPDAINNSWGYSGGNYPAFEDEIAALQAAGILVEVSAGNDGPYCQSLGSPGDYSQSLTTGSINHTGGSLPGTLTSFSSRGPSDLYPGDHIPDVMAPGENIRSSLPGNTYASWSGTSMAGPHVTGLIGLIWSANPGLRGMINETVQIIQDTGVPLTGQTGSNCGGDYTAGPNNDWGFGTIDALAAVQQAMLYGDTGILAGTVTNQNTLLPIPDATIQASPNPTLTWQTTSDSLGNYSLNVFSGTHTVSASAYGYQPQNMANVSIVSGTTTTLPIALSPAPSYVVSGTVTDANTGWPLFANLDIDDYPGSTIWSDPVTGYYSVALAAGIAYNFNVTASHYTIQNRTVGPLTGHETRNFTLQPDFNQGCPLGYRQTTLFSDSFETGSLSSDWSISTSGQGRVQISSAYPYSGTYSALLDVARIENATAALILTRDLSGQDQVDLDFWWREFYDENDVEDGIFISDDYGASWYPVLSFNNGPLTFRNDVIDLSAAAAANGLTLNDHFQIKFQFYDNYPIPTDGYAIDEVKLRECTPFANGRVIGYVYDANTGLPLAGAAVNSDNNQTTLTNINGFYELIDTPGIHTITATMSIGYGPDVQTVAIAQNITIQRDFNLPAGQLSHTPPTLEITLGLGERMTMPFNLTNNGGVATTFELQERDRGFTILRHSQELPYEPRVVTYWDPSESADTNSESLTLSWDTHSPIPTGPRYRAAGTSCDGQTYYIFGGWQGFGVLDEAWKYDPDSDSWTMLAPMPRALTNLDATCIGNYIYLVGGYTGSAQSNNFQIYDIVNNSWIATTWPNVRTPMTAAWDGKLYAFGGHPSPSNETWMYNPATGQWTGPLASMPMANSYGATVTVGDYIYQIGGYPQANAVQRYDPANNIWDTSGPQLQDNRMSALAVWYGDHIYVVSGGGSGGIWNAWDTTEVYNPSDWPGGAWTYDDEIIAIPAVAMAGSCAGDQVWGAGGYNGGVETDANQSLNDDQTCNFNADTPWLSESPTSGVVASSANLPITIIFDASVPEITQPGHYYAELKIEDDTPYSLPNVPVTMTVIPSPGLGKLTGAVTGLEHCDEPGTPLENANLILEGGTGMTWTLSTDPAGLYAIWLDEANSPLTAIVSYPGYVPQTITGINVTAGQTTTQNVNLRLDVPCVSASPSDLNATVNMGASKTLSFTLTNTGAAMTPFKLQEQDQGFALAERSEEPLHAEGQVRIIEESKGAIPDIANSGSLPLSSGGPDPFGYTYIDSNEPDGPIYDWIEIAPPAGGSGTEIADLTGVNNGYFWPLSLPFTFNFYGTDYTELAVASNGTLYFEDSYLGLSNVSIPGYNAYGVNTFIAHLWDDLVIDPGAVYYQMVDSTLVIEYYQVSGFGGSTNGTWQAILFENGNILFQYQDVIFDDIRDNGGSATVGIQNDAVTGLQYSYNTAALSDGLAICFAYPGQSSDCSPPDVPWLSENPDTGTLAVDGHQSINVIFDSSVVTQAGQYYATLQVKSNDPLNLSIGIPVTMTVAAYGLTLAPSTNTQAGDPGTTVAHTLRVTNTGNTVDTFDVVAAGHTWTTAAPVTVGPLAAGTSADVAVAVTIPPTAAGNVLDTTTIAVTSQGDNTQSAAATLTTIANNVYGVMAVPSPTIETGSPGAAVSYTLHITNTGNTTDTFHMTTSGNTWPVVTPLGPGTASTVVTVGPLPTGTSEAIEIMVMIPAEVVSSAADTVIITVTSQGDDTQSAAITLTTASGTTTQKIFLPIILNR